MNILDFLELNEVPEDFDEQYYEEQCPDVIHFYEPYATNLDISTREKYFFHYTVHGKKMGVKINIQSARQDISVLIACKNRSKNLKEVLSGWHEVDSVKEIIIVDYDSEEDLNITLSQEKFVYPKINIVRVENEETFNLGKAYNLAFDFSTCDFIIKIDCDYKLLDSSWIDKYFKNRNASDYFIRGDYGFSRYTSGFFLVNRNMFPYFREDLNGYGYDEIDLYNRIKSSNPQAKEVIMFDIDNYIYHIPHENEERSQFYFDKDITLSEKNNRQMCEIFSPHEAPRVNYFIDNGHVRYNREILDKIFCINLDDRSDRWESLKNNDLAERIPAIDSRSNIKICEQYGLKLQPSNLSAKAYFNCSHGAVGAYLSHYAIWQKMVKENIAHALIIEDDVQEDAIERVLNSNIIFADYDIINLSKRVSWNESSKSMFFDGAEAYVLSNSGAQKLINATHFPILLDKIHPQVYDSLKNMEYSDWSYPNSLTCPVDKFISYCCQPLADERIKMRSYLYPILELGEKSNDSDINKTSKYVWEMNTNEIMRIVNENI